MSYTSAQREAKRRRAKRFGIASAILFLLMFMVGEMLMPTLRDMRDSLKAAEDKYDTDIGLSTLTTQLVTIQQQIEAAKIETLRAAKDPNLNFPALIVESMGMTQQIKTDLNSTFAAVSSLVDALPRGATQLRGLRDQMKTQVEARISQIDTDLKSKAKPDASRLVSIKLNMVMALVQEIPVLLLGDEALTTAKNAQNADTTLLNWSTRLFWILGLSAGILGVCAAAAGIKLVGG